MVIADIANKYAQLIKQPTNTPIIFTEEDRKIILALLVGLTATGKVSTLDSENINALSGKFKSKTLTDAEIFEVMKALDGQIMPFLQSCGTVANKARTRGLK